MTPMPNTIIGLIEMLELQYPPRCLSPEELRSHADHYAGKSALIVELRARFESELKREKDKLPRVL